MASLRSFHPPLRRLTLIGLLAGAAAAPVLAASDFPPISEAERALTSVPEYPNAPAVVLFRKGRFSTLDPVRGIYDPTFTVIERRKILTAAGAQRYSDVVLHHSRRQSLLNLKARTVLPDGRVVPLPKDATFKRRTSSREGTFETAISFPSVSVGAILDYRYEVRLGFGFYIYPWYFQEEVPTVHSEIVYEIPANVAVSSWTQDPMQTGIQRSSTAAGMGGRIVAWGDHLPPLPEEPQSVPYADLASSFMLLPDSVVNLGRPQELFRDWASTCGIFAKDYDDARRRSRNAERKAREIAQAVPGGDRRGKALALYRFVRDEIDTEDAWGISLPEDSNVDSVLAAGHGRSSEKALLLQTLLAAAGIESRTVWAANRKDGLVNMKLATPWWFDRILVAVDLEGKRVFLDPSDRSLAFGHLAPMTEGMPALLYDPEKPEVVQLPLSPIDQNTRQAKIDMELDTHGGLRGKGTLRLIGHPAWEKIRWQPGAEKATQAWKEWLEEAYRGYTVGDVRVDEEVDEERVEVSWTMTEREDEVLEDEATLPPSRPLGPVHQPFAQPAADRRTTVLFDDIHRDEVEMTLRWPEGWKPETLPSDILYKGAAGEAVTSITMDEPGRSLTYRRRLDIVQRELPKSSYPAAQALFGAMERHDAQMLTLVPLGR